MTNILELAQDEPDANAVDDLSRCITRAQLVDRALRIGAMLAPLGVAGGGHVVLVMGNRTDFIEICLAALLSGRWVTPVSLHLSATEASYVVEDSGAAAVFTDSEHEEKARAAAGARPVVVVGEEWDREVAGADALRPDLAAAPGGNMFYTSGTTGRPKGVIRAPRPTLAEALDAHASAGSLVGLDGRGPNLVTGPLYHAAPLGFATYDLHAGAEVVLMPSFDAARTLDLIDERQIRHTHVVPTMCTRLLRLPDESRESFDGSSLGLVLHGAAPISPAVKNQMIEWWGPVLVEYWGGSEGGVATLVDSDDWLANPGTVGRPVAGHEVYAGDESGEPLPVGDTGLLWCRNLQFERPFQYHGDADKTARTAIGDGRYTLGDVGRVDDGFVFLADRQSHLIISGGVNIYPAEVEAVLGEHPAVADVAVFGVPDEEWGESVRAAVELVDGSSVAGVPLEGSAEAERLHDEILSFAQERLAGFKVPGSMEFHESLPRHDTGKLRLHELKDPHWPE